jgi:hypothetical protein
MSWRKAAELARSWAALARREADELEQDEAELQEIRAELLERFATACMQRSSFEDITVIDRKRG